MTTRLWDAPFTVNTTTAGTQENARTATLSDGRFVVVWDDQDTDSIRFQIYGADGQPDGAEQTEINFANQTGVGFSDVVATSDGGFIIGFHHSPGNIDLQRYDSTGNAGASSSYTNGVQSGTDVRLSVSGNDLWIMHEGTSVVVLGRYNISGTGLNFTSQDTDVSSADGGDDILPDITTLANGNVVALWHDSPNSDLAFRILSAPDVYVTGDISVDTDVNTSVANGQVTALANGGFVVSWADSNGFPGVDFDIYFNVYAPDGTLFTGPEIANSAVGGAQYGATVVATQDGFAVFYMSGAGSSGARASIVGRLFDGTGFPLGGEFTVGGEINSVPAVSPINATLLADGRISVVWEEGLGDIGGQIVDPRGVNIGGTPGDDEIYGNNGREEIFGGWGNDTLYGMADNDSLFGGIDNDSMSGDAGEDLLYGGVGLDTLEGGDGNDTLYGQNGNDLLAGGDGMDRIFAGANDDTVQGGSDDDYVRGEAGDDSLLGGTGDDTLEGGDGEDTIFGQNDDDEITGGGENDRIFAGSGNDVVNGDAGFDFLRGDAGDDTLFGGNGNDTVQGSDGLDVLYGQNGNDNIQGGADNDRIFAGNDNDTITGDGGDDLVRGENGNDFVQGGTGADTVQGGSGNDSVYGQNGDDSITGDTGNDRIFGGADNDTINGGADDDFIRGDAGDDDLIGGIGNDTLTGSTGADRFIFAFETGDDTVTDFVLGVDDLMLSSALVGSATDGDDVVDMFGIVLGGNATLIFDTDISITFTSLGSLSGLADDITIF